ncbi:amino acid ABC transporter ATP-binding protein [Agrococcus sp. SGAir0287]|uniref:amino acid ABC transporter ATP-binding protein n=1 Tax=Agrococcus sp. SGAir0287 TaxID=2070347 RepID=UPI0010CD4264|nr:amino acid ABC transporter ATP-binding protein [Agrococcus sp. SGAir0287]QCR19371.1 glutamine ABC transporter ATP-binding protein [Agrococcus sp. SGAir0287]
MPSDVPPTSQPLLAARGLTKSFGDRTVLHGVDLDLWPGRVHALIGPSGSGKTTVLRSLNGLEVPEEGTLTTPDWSVDLARGLSRSDRARLAALSSMVFQQHHLFPHLSVLDNVVVGPTVVQRVPRAEAVERAMALLERVGLGDRGAARPSELSGGQQQRVGIVRAMAMRPQMLLFDEPTSALDPELVGEVLRVVGELADDGWTMAIVTHELAFARAVADEVSFFDEGRIVEHGTPEALFDAPRSERLQRFLRRLTDPLG